MQFRLSLAPLLLAAALTLTASGALDAQSAAKQNGRLRVFLDCPTGGCDRNFFITELPFALWTQDRLDADVHVLVTGLGTGAGGTEYTLSFIGRNGFSARTDTLVSFVAPNSTDDMRRRDALLRALRRVGRKRRRSARRGR